ncbi:MAG: hypothetical protein AVDCRST_MAG56-3443 [uncultured Cytophagales bacterium]|uniref:JmjC domain-containing protein n=1 Tax=uncultured Cytophagales bacterium TaxID=158755 RepID=A0A6J4JAM2_9SPHI|nr:MAG: hypothetical protein AVDCRST_MAG56-3443 [uncultured Cytophagales bacterium]
MSMHEILEQKEQVSTFQDLLYPFKAEGFTQEYWEKKPLMVQRGDAGYYQSLFSIDNVDELLDLTRPQGKSIRIVKNQEPLMASKYENADGSLNLNQIYLAYADGYTVVVNEIDRFWKPLKALCQNISAFLNQRAVANMYLTPKNQKALLPHYDTHDVYVVQVHGTKHWKIYDVEYPIPLVNSFQPVFQREQLKNVRNVTLHAGDLMYIPRGVPHEAVTTDESSLHLTIGVYPTQWADLLVKSIMHLAHSHPTLRQSLPIGCLQPHNLTAATAAAMNNHMQALLQDVLTHANAQGALQLLAEEFRMSQQARGDGHFAHLDRLDEINVHTTLVKRPNMTCTVQQIGASARIIYPGNVIKGPIHITPALLFIASSTNEFQVAEIPELADENKVKLAQKLIRGGLLQVAAV